MLTELGIALVLQLFIVVLAYLILNRYLSASFFSPIQKLSAVISAGKGGIELSPLVPNEIKSLANTYFEMREKLEQNANDTAFNKIASQVAHDIRSPLSALDVVLANSGGLDEDKRVLARSAIARIKDIANNLISHTKFKKMSTALMKSSEPKAIILLASLVDSLVSEKRTQFRSLLYVILDYEIDASSYGVFVNVHSSQLSRALSNLINNAVESLLHNRGRISISLKTVSDFVEISIIDNGKGIPKDILPRLGERGITFGKENSEAGSGLGLFHARETFAACGGNFRIESKVNSGTKVTATLPLACPPNWFVRKINVKPNSRIVIVDDDTSIHQIWQSRFDSMKLDEHKIGVFHFSTPSDLENWSNAQPSLNNTVFLIDYEYLGQSQNGLDIIEILKIGKQAVLVTGRYEDVEILRRAEDMGVCFIPKGMAGLVPIEVINSKCKPHAILIDDDELVHETWRLAFASKFKKLISYTTARDFIKNHGKFDFDTSIYIDVNLANGERGEIISKEIFMLGFKNIRLVTGYDASEFRNLAHIKAVVGKAPPA